MSVDLKGDFRGGLNLDDSPYAVPKTSYIDAQNITRDAIAGSNDHAITNVLGNQLVAYDLPGAIKIKVTFPYEGLNNKALIEIFGPDNIPANAISSINCTYLGNPYVIGTYTNTTPVAIYDYALFLSDVIATNAIVTASTPNLNTIVVDLSVSTTTDWYADAQSTALNECIGAYSNVPSNNVIYFIYNEYGNHEVLNYDLSSGNISKVFENRYDSANVDLLRFTNDKKITSVNVYNYDTGDLLYFLDTEGRPTYMDVERLSTKAYGVVTRELIEVIKRPPLYPMGAGYGNDTSRKSNYLTNKLFRFKYRYVYDNYEKSTCSPISQLGYPEKILDDAYTNIQTNNNLIYISADTGDKDVKFVELLMSYSNKTNEWSDFSLIETIDKASDMLLRSTVEISMNYPVLPPTPWERVIIKFSGYLIPIGTNISIAYTTPVLPTVIGNYTTVGGDTIASIVTALVASINAGTGTHGISATSGGNFIILNNISNIANLYNNIFLDFPADYSIDNQQITYPFYNDGIYPYIDINESILLYDYVPLNANAQELANGNVLVYGGITEGYDRDLSPNVAITTPVRPSGNAIVVSTLSANITQRSNYKQVKFGIPPYLHPVHKDVITFSGISGPGTIVITLKESPGGTTHTYTMTTSYGMTSSYIANTFRSMIFADIPLYGLESVDVNNTSANSADLVIIFNADPLFPNWSVDTIVYTPSFSNYNIVPTFLHSTQRKLGMAYFDQYGRTNGILYSGKVSFPSYSEDVATSQMELPYIHTEVFHKPPVWAHSYAFYLTKEYTQFLYWVIKGIKSDADYLYFDITNLAENIAANPTTGAVLTYNFKDGDRVKLLRKVTGTSYYSSDYDTQVLGVVKNAAIGTGTYVKIKIAAPFSAALTDEPYIIQLYTPPQGTPSDANEVFYEFGQSYPIGYPETESRYHISPISSQTIDPSLVIDANTYNGGVSIIRFSGVSIGGIVINIYIYDLTTSSNVLIATYTTLDTDTSDTIAFNINQLLQTAVGVQLTSSTYNTDVIEITYDDTLYSFDQQQIEYTFPSNVPAYPAKFDFYYGDVYFKQRKIFVTYSPVSSYVITCLDRNFSDNYTSAVNSVEGRPNIIDINLKNEYYPAFIRHGQAIQPNTNINGLNRFYPTSYEEVDSNFGDIQRLKVRDRFMRVFQRLKVGKIPLYQQIVKNADNENLVVSDKLLNPVNYYIGDVGIGDNPESLASFNYADYFTSNIKGVICRINESGVEFLSITKKVNSWANSWVGNPKGRFMVGTFDQRLSNYILALSGDFGSPQRQGPSTIVFDDEIGNFETFLTMYPEMMTTFGTTLISFLNGRLYVHDGPDYNTWYGNPTDDSYIKPIFNENPYVKKTFVSFSEIASELWDVPNIETSLNQQSNLVDTDFIDMEGTFEAPILRDANSPGGVIDGDILKGKYIIPTIRKNSPSLVALNIVSLKYIPSPLTNT